MTVSPRSRPVLELAVLVGGAVWLAIGGDGAARAVLGAAVLAAVVAAARSLLPREPSAGVVAAILLAVAPPFRDAIARDVGSVVLALAPVIATLAFGFARGGRRRDAAIAGTIAAAIGAIACTGVAGALPPWFPGVSAIVTDSGRGAAAIVVAAGLLGAGFGTLTDLRGARVLLGAIAIAAVAGMVVPLLAVLAVGAAIVPAAMTRAAGTNVIGFKRQLITIAAGIPLLAGAAITGAAVGASPTAIPDRAAP